MPKYDLAIVGTGFSGSILARKIAKEQNTIVFVSERRSHIASNMYDFADENGIRI